MQLLSQDSTMAYAAQAPKPSTSEFSPSISTSERRHCFYADPMRSLMSEGYGMHSCLPADAMQDMIDNPITAAVQSGLGRTGSNSPADCYRSTACDDKAIANLAAAACSLDSHNIASHAVCHSMLYSKYRSAQGRDTAQQQQQCVVSQRTLIHSQSCTAAETALRQHQLLLLQQQQAAVSASTAASEQQQQPHMPLYGNYNRTIAAQCGSTSTSGPGDYSITGQFPASSINQLRAATGAARLPPCPSAAISSQPRQPQHTTRPADCCTFFSDCHHPASVLQQAEQQHSLFTTSSSGASASTAFAAPAQTAPLVGRWSGQVAVLDASAFPGLCETDEGHSGFTLECEEELLSLGATDAYLYHVKASQTSPATGRDNNSSYMQQGQKTHNCSVEVDAMLANDSDMLAHIEESGSSKDDLPSSEQPAVDMYEDQGQEHDACPTRNHKDQADPAALADEQQTLAHHRAATHMLEVVAAKRDPQRKGKLVLTATYSTAVSAGAESVRPRLLITEVSVYVNSAANSLMALDQANQLMGKMRLPGNVQYMPVSPDSFLFKAGAAWQFPAFVICLGSSYLQRMLVRLPQLAEAVLACPGFEDYAEYLAQQPAVPPPRLSGPEAVATLATLRSVQFTCLYLATKVADQIHALGLLRFMLTNLSHTGAMVTTQQACNVEASCLEALEWRLGPFFFEDELTGDDEELWAQSMGHFDYGTERDSYPETF